MSSLFSQQQAIEQSLNWQALQPDLVIQDFPLEPVDFWALQPNATQVSIYFYVIRHVPY